MTIIRKKHNKEIKFKAALALYKSEKTVSEISQEYGVHQSVLQRWKKTLLEMGPGIFEDQRSQRQSQANGDSTVNLERKIGQLVMEVDFLKKVSGQ
jgi:transposase